LKAKDDAVIVTKVGYFGDPAPLAAPIDDQQEKDALHGNQPKRRRNRDPGADRQGDARRAPKRSAIRLTSGPAIS